MTTPNVLLRSAWRRYGTAVVVTGLVVLGRLALNPWWGHHRNRNLVLIPAVMLSAWMGGLGPGLLVLVPAAIGLAGVRRAVELTAWAPPSSAATPRRPGPEP